MTIKVFIENVKKLGEGVWQTELSEDEIWPLGAKRRPDGLISIILVTDTDCFDPNKKTLELSPSSFQIIKIGRTKKTIIILDNESEIVGNIIREASVINSLHKDYDSTKSNIIISDKKFIDDLDQLPIKVQELGTNLLRGIREFYDNGVLKFHGKSKKFVESPDNFWTVRIQPRDRSLRITVRGLPEEHRNICNSIELKKDMTSYSAFKINRPEQLIDAIKIIKNAYHL